MKKHAPPPTAFGPRAPVQGKTAGPPLHPPPPTAYSPASRAIQAKATPTTGPIHQPPPTAYGQPGRPAQTKPVATGTPCRVAVPPPPTRYASGLIPAPRRPSSPAMQRMEEANPFGEKKTITFVGQKVRVLENPAWEGTITDSMGDFFVMEKVDGQFSFAHKKNVIFSRESILSGDLKLPTEMRTFLIKEPNNDDYYHATSKANLAQIIGSGGLHPRTQSTSGGFVGLDASRSDQENISGILEEMHKIHDTYPEFSNKTIVETMLGNKGDFVYVTRRWDTVEDYAREIKEKYKGGDPVIFRFKLGTRMRYNDAQSASAVRLAVGIPVGEMEMAEWRPGTSEAGDLVWGVPRTL